MTETNPMKATAAHPELPAPARAPEPAPPFVVQQRSPRSLSKFILFFILSAFALFGLVALVFISFSAGALLRRTPASTFTAGVATIDQVRSLKLLTVLSFDVTSDMEAEHAERRGMWLARGSADYAVDFARTQVVRADEGSRTISLRLPLPAVRNARLDAARTKLLTYEKTGWGFWTFGAAGSRDEFESQSRVMLQRRIEQAAGEAALLESAKGSAVQLMSSLYAPVNWTVKVEWDERR
ncbi:MAG: DUF4230 domain-containing protein [Phycisphaerales bacterium]|nr:DUF4230 domain-containing protein [Phycisphaerales bacterium]